MRIDLTDRQRLALLAVKHNSGCTASDVAEFIEPGSDSRGAGQTLRSMQHLVVRRDGTYRLTDAGRSKANRIQKAVEPAAA